MSLDHGQGAPWASEIRRLEQRIAALEAAAKPPQGDVGADSGLAAADDNREAVATLATWDGATAAARRAIYAEDGRGMVGHLNRNDLQNRVARAIQRAAMPSAYLRSERAADDNHKALVEALEKIRAIKREPIGDTGFATGPLAHFQAAQRIATEALAAFQSRQEEKQP